MLTKNDFADDRFADKNHHRFLKAIDEHDGNNREIQAAPQEQGRVLFRLRAGQ